MKNAGSLLESVRTKKPVVHHITNWVTIYDCAGIVKMFGASPVMAHAAEEAAAMASIASSLVLNIGTLTPELVTAMKLAAQQANTRGIPVILDVCGAGATRLRDDSCFDLLEKTHIDIIKGNASEIARIAGENVVTKGVDSTEVNRDLSEIALALAARRSSTVVITGKEDIIAGSDGMLFVVKNGHELMANVVGTGCMAASVIGTFAAVEKDLPLAAAAGLVCYEVAAELAAKDAQGPASFKEKLFDAVWQLDAATVESMARCESRKARQ